MCARYVDACKKNEREKQGGSLKGKYRTRAG